MRAVAGLIDEVLTKQDDVTVARVRHQVEELAGGFPLYVPAGRDARSGAAHR
jgi:hypothetical protein